MEAVCSSKTLMSAYKSTVSESRRLVWSTPAIDAENLCVWFVFFLLREVIPSLAELSSVGFVPQPLAHFDQTLQMHALL
jgi:hypothetical protein